MKTTHTSLQRLLQQYLATGTYKTVERASQLFLKWRTVLVIVVLSLLLGVGALGLPGGRIRASESGRALAAGVSRLIASARNVIGREVHAAARAAKPSSAAAMNTIVVNDPGGGKTGTSNPPPAGQCTLRDAIVAANTDAMFGNCSPGSGADTIMLPIGQTVTLTDPDNAEYGFNGLPAITSNITIVGVSGTIARATSALSFRLFYVSPTGSLTLQNVDLHDGLAQGGKGGNGPSDDGGGGGGAGLGGAIFNQGTLNVINSSLSANRARGGAGGQGGKGVRGTNDNEAGGGGGGSAEKNKNYSGGTSAFGGGSGGQSADDFNGGGGGGGAGLGGAIFNHGGTVTITNSTISGNTALGGSGGGKVSSNQNGASGKGLGGGLFSRNGSVTINNATFSDNVSTDGGGIFALGDGAVAIFVLRNTIVANSSAASDCQIAGIANGSINPGNSNHNLIEDNNGSFNACPGLLISDDPKLGPLQFNAPGNTRTHALSTASGNLSPAIDRGLTVGGVTTDQRGEPRPFDYPGVPDPSVVDSDTADIGAYEVQGVPCPNINITITPPTIPGGQPGVPYSQMLTASGGTAPYTFSAPPTDGLTLDANGLLHGTPTLAGTFFFPVKATDANNCTGTQNYSLTINCPPITVNPPTLPDGQFGAPYNQMFTASGGLSSYTFSLSDGVLPDGLALTSDGKLTGIPINAGSFTFTIKATDNGDCVGVRQYTLVIAGADLSIMKGDAPDPVVAGNNLTYTLSVNNAGPSPGHNVVVTDPLPPGLMFVSAVSSDPGFICVNANNTVACTKAVFAVGASAAFTIVAKVNSDVSSGTVLANTATVAGTTNDPNPANNNATTTTMVTTDANLAITKTDNPDPVIAGGNLTYHITVANAGPSDARSVVLIDLLPNSPSNAVTFVSSTGTGVFAAAGACTLVGKVLTCTATPGGILRAGEAANLDVVVKVNPNLIAGANLTNSATVNWTDTTTPPANTATATATTTVLRECDLMLTLTDSPQAVIAGNDIIYTIKVTNKGPSGLNPGEYEVRQAVFPPAQTTLVGSISAPGFDCDGGAGLPCLNTAQLAPGAMATISYRVKVNANFAPIPGFVANLARVALAGDPLRADDAARKAAIRTAAQQLGVVDPDPSNNAAAVNTAVGPNADLQLAKTAAPASVVAGLAGSIITYTINYQNSGPSNANGVVISDTVAANLIPVGVIAAPGLSCNGTTAAASVQFTCTPNANAFGAPGMLNAAGVLPAGAGGTLTFQARVPASVPAGTLITNGATIASTGANATPDPNTANNTQQPTSTLVTTTADLSITKSGAPNPVTAGNNLTYTLTVSNAGPSEASAVVVTDNLPANLTFVSSASSDPGFACAVSNNKVTCTKTAFAASASATITIIGKVKAETPNGALLTNTATIASASADPNSANNSANATTRVVTDATVTISQSDNPDPVVAGTNFTYRLSIASTGPSDARDVILTDILPNAPANAVTFVSVTGTGIFAPAGVCAQASGILVCDATGANLKAGETANIDVVLKVNADVPAGTLLANTATVNWTDGVPDPDSATAVETTLVKHESDLSITKEAPADVGAGQRFDYRLTVRSAGPSDVLGGAAAGTMTVVDTLPAGVAPVLPLASPNVTVSGPGGFTCSYDAAMSKVTCRNAAGASGNFAAGSTLTVIFKVQVASGATDGSSLSNCATVNVTAPESDPVSGNNQACISTTIRPTADLSIGKTAQPVSPVPGSNPPAVRAGENIRYTITFGNAGPSDALNVKITDNVPGNTALVTASFPATVTATGGAFTGANTIKLACAYNTATNAISCMPMGNAGLTPAVIDGVLPAGVTGTLVYEAKVNASVTGGTIVSNAANIASAAGGTTTGTPDPNTANNTSLPTSTPILAGSQLTITSIVQSAATQASNPNRTGPLNAASASGTLAAPGTGTTGTPVVPGTELTYRLIVTNGGPSDIANIQVVDTLPTGVSYVGANQIDGNATFTCFNTGGAVTCNAPLLPAPQTGVGNAAVFDIVVRIDPAARNALVNNSKANGKTNGFNQPVGAATQLTTPLQAVSDLLATKTHTPEPVIAGNNVMYTVRAQNFGPSSAMALQIVDALPAGQTFTLAEVLFPAPLPGQPSLVTCTGTTTVTCVGTAAGGLAFAPNDFVTLRLTARVDTCTNPNAYVNTAMTTSSSALPAPPRNVATDTVNVVARPDLAITKTAPTTVIAGLTMSYVIEATNNGPSCAQDVMIGDALPAGTVFVAATASAGGVAAATNPAVGAGGNVKFTWTGLTSPTTKRTLAITVRVCSEVLCDTALANTATVSYAPRIPNPLPPAPVTDPPFQAPGDWDKDPVAANNAATATTTAQAQSDLAISKTGPARATPGQTITYTLTFSNAGPSNVAGTMIVDTLPKGFTVVGQPVSSVAGTTFQITTTDGVTAVRATLGALGAANQCATARPAAGTITINVLVPIKHPVITVTNTTTVSTTNCLADPSLANNTATFSTVIDAGAGDPGASFPALSEISDQKAGSVLFFPIYTSDAVNGNQQNTKLSITNISANEQACVHLFAMDGSTCAVLDLFVCLTPNQTTTFQAADLDPGATGFMMAVAVDCTTGLPAAFNCLIGDEYVKFASGHAANLGAEAVSATMVFPAGTDANSPIATLKFDGASYNRLPRVVAADNIPSPADGNSTMAIINRIGGNLATSGAPIGNLTGLLIDDTEVTYSFTANQNLCQYRKVLDNSFPRTLTPFARVITAGRTGWMKFWAFDDKAIFGAQINFNANAASNANLFNQGHNLHKLTLTDATTLIVPVFIPSC